MSTSKNLPTSLSIQPYLLDFLMPLTNIQRKEQRIMAQQLAAGTHFDEEEVRLLLLMLWYVAPNKKSFDRGLFRQMVHGIFQLTDDIIMDRLFRLFDRDNDGLINQEEWIRGMSTFLRAQGDERPLWAFTIYDMNSDGYLTREEIFHLLKGSMVKLANEEDRDDSIKDMVEMINKKMDEDKDGRISLSDFSKATEKDSLLLQAFGRCFPDQEGVDNFTIVLNQFKPQL